MAEPTESAAPHRAHAGELISAGSALALLVLMFAAEWFGLSELPGRANGVQRSTAENAWNAMPALRWLMLLTIAVAIGSLALHATQRSHGTTNDTGGLIAGLGTLTAILLIVRVLIDLPSSNEVVDQKLGAILGVLCALGIAFGGHASMREERARTRIEHRSRTAAEGVAEHVSAR